MFTDNFEKTASVVSGLGKALSSGSNMAKIRSGAGKARKVYSGAGKTAFTPPQAGGLKGTVKSTIKKFKPIKQKLWS